MMSSILIFILNLIMQFISLLLGPIDEIIFRIGGTIADSLSYIWQFFTLICGSLMYVLDMLAIPINLIVLILNYFIFKGVLWIGVNAIKIFVKWWGKIW